MKGWMTQHSLPQNANPKKLKQRENLPQHPSTKSHHLKYPCAFQRILASKIRLSTEFSHFLSLPVWPRLHAEWMGLSTGKLNRHLPDSEWLVIHPVKSVSPSSYNMGQETLNQTTMQCSAPLLYGRQIKARQILLTEELCTEEHLVPACYLLSKLGRTILGQSCEKVSH